MTCSEVSDLARSEPTVPACSQSPLIEVRGLRAGYSEVSWALSSVRREVIAGVSLQMRGGEIVALVADNGGGKSTLLRAIVDPRSRFDGEVLCDGVRLTADSIAYVPQAAATTLSPWATVAQEAALPWRIRGVKRAVWFGEVRSRCEAFHIALPLERRVEQLSAGQRIQVAVLRALMRSDGAKLAVLDEPFEGLSASTRAWVVKMIRQWASDGVAVLLTSHRSEDLAALGARRLRLTGVPVRTLEPLNGDGQGLPQRADASEGAADDQTAPSGDAEGVDVLERVPSQQVSGARQNVSASIAALVGLAAGLALWATVAFFVGDPGLLPGPPGVLVEMARAVTTPERAGHFLATIARALGSWAAAIILAIPVGISLGYQPRLFRFVAPWLSIGRCVPVFALAGTAIGLFPGMPDVQRCALIVTTLFLIALQITSLGAAVAPRRRMDLARVFGAGWWFQVRHVLIHECRGSIMASLETTLPISVIVTLVVEVTLLPRWGVGAYIFNHMTDRDLSIMYAYLLLPACVTAILMWVLRFGANSVRYEL